MSKQDYINFFNNADTNKSGTLDKDEFVAMLKKAGQGAKAHDLFIQADRSADNEISVEEFLDVMGYPTETKMPARREWMLDVFRSFDKNSDGTIDKSELTAVFVELGKKMPEAHIDRLMKIKDQDDSGSLDYVEFVDALSKA